MNIFKSLFVLLSILPGAFAMATNLKCVDNYEREFKGTVWLVMQGQYATQMWYAENTTHNKPHYKFIENFTPSPANKYIRGGSEYTAVLPTEKGYFTSKLSLNTMGDQLTISTESYTYTLTCNEK